MFFLDLDNSGGSADQSVAFGEPDDLPIIGDWDGDGDDNIGLYRPGSTTGVFYLDIDNDGGSADIVTPEYGDLGDIPIAGDWDGDGDDNIGVYRPGTGEFFMDATLPEVLPSKTIYVDDDFSDNPSEHKWDTIQEGVDDASDGDTVIVYAGEYVENVNIYGQGRLTLIGEGTDVVTVTAASASADDDVFEVFADYVDISGFTVTGATQSYGVGAGICLFYAEHCNISNNNISNNSCGIYMEDTSNNTLRNNAISGNGWNFGVFGKSLSHHIHDIDTSNTVNGKPIYYWINQQNEQIPCDAGFVGVVNCTNITVNDLTSTSVLFAYTEDSRIENVTASDNWIGIYLKESNNNTLQSNNAFNNKCGIGLSSSDSNILQSNNVSGIWYGVGIALGNSNNNILRGNNASNNEYYGSGITMEESNNNTLQSNNAFNNGCGIALSSSNNNTLYHNNLIDNTYCNAYDSGTNQWDSGSEGNYYSDYNGTDNDTDGIGEDTYPIPGGDSIDRFPLMQPWTDTPPPKGDLNGDDHVTPADAAIALTIAVGGSASCDITTFAAADVSGDNRVTALDALMILQAASGSITL
jgi:parallel beta-helix repeat protein